MTENNNNEIKEKIKTHIKDYVYNELGVSVNKDNFFRCLNPTHEDVHPSMSLNEKNNTVHCFSCNTTYDIYQIYAIENNLDCTKDFKKIISDLAYKYGYELPHSNYENKVPSYQSVKVNNNLNFENDYTKWKKNIDQTTYLIDRGIKQELITKYNVGYDASKRSVIFPISSQFYVSRKVDVDTNDKTKYAMPKGCSVELFNYDNFKNSTVRDVIFVAEGIIDALSIESLGNHKTVAINGVTHWPLVIDAIKKEKYKGSIILCFDGDGAGQKASQDLQAALDSLNITNHALSNMSGGKDINEQLISSPDSLAHLLKWLQDSFGNIPAGKIKQENILNNLDSLLEDFKKEATKPKLITGLSKLDKFLVGIQNNLYVIGAMSGLGKTTICLQIADALAAQGNDVLFFSLEMSKKELVSKSISRETFINAFLNNKDYKAAELALTNLSILNGKLFTSDFEKLVPDEKKRQAIMDNYNEAVERYKKSAENLYICECQETEDCNISAISERIENHIEATQKKPIVFVDYLQIIKSGQKLDDKQEVDFVISELRRISRKYEIPVFTVSSLNRASYDKTLSFAAFKESSSVEYTADVVIALQHQSAIDSSKENKSTIYDEEQKKTDRKINVSTLKNRNGLPSEIDNVDYYAAFNYFALHDYN